MFGECKVNKNTDNNCGIQYCKLTNGDVQMHPDEYIETLRPTISSELTCAPKETNSTANMSNQFGSLRGALAYTLLTQAWIQVYVLA